MFEYVFGKTVPLYLGTVAIVLALTVAKDFSSVESFVFGVAFLAAGLLCYMLFVHGLVHDFMEKK